MQNINSSEELKNAIQLLELERAGQRELLKEQFIITYESLKPINIIRRTLKELTSSHDLTDDILGTASGLASGYLSKKIFMGKSVNVFRKLIGSILQFRVTSAVYQHPVVIKTLGKFIFQYLFRRREIHSEENEIPEM